MPVSVFASAPAGSTVFVMVHAGGRVARLAAGALLAALRAVHRVHRVLHVAVHRLLHAHRAVHRVLHVDRTMRRILHRVHLQVAQRLVLVASTCVVLQPLKVLLATRRGQICVFISRKFELN
jgi:hypothetical protein